MLNTRTPIEPAAPNAYGGPERRRRPALAWRLVTAMLDEVDYGMLLVADDGHVLHANHTALRELQGEHPLQLLGRQLRVHRPENVVALRDALDGALRRGLRRLLHFADGSGAVDVAVVPVGPPDGTQASAALLTLGRRQEGRTLAVQCFARSQGLTTAETAVLGMLCTGCEPLEIATQQQVAISTVRTQISSIRAKTGASSIRELIHQVASLPPMVGALRTRHALADA